MSVLTDFGILRFASDLGVWKDRGVESGRFLSVAVEPETVRDSLDRHFCRI